MNDPLAELLTEKPWNLDVRRLREAGLLREADQLGEDS